MTAANCGFGCKPTATTVAVLFEPKSNGRAGGIGTGPRRKAAGGADLLNVSRSGGGSGSAAATRTGSDAASATATRTGSGWGWGAGRDAPRLCAKKIWNGDGAGSSA